MFGHVIVLFCIVMLSVGVINLTIIITSINCGCFFACELYRAKKIWRSMNLVATTRASRQKTASVPSAVRFDIIVDVVLVMEMNM